VSKSRITEGEKRNFLSHHYGEQCLV